MKKQTEWVALCRRTEDPKLAYLEFILLARGIQSRRNGESCHAPILEVPAAQASEGWGVLALPARKALGLPVRYGVQLDEIPDDHACFRDWSEQQ